ncbi:MAG: hypothetical protein AAFX44_18385 [Pseudomonadota bacterium]
MIGAAVSAFLAWLFFSRWPPTKEFGIDLPITIAVVPILLGFLLGLLIGLFELPPDLALISLSFFVLVPLLVLKLMFSLSWKNSAIGTAVVVAITVVVQVSLTMLLARGD